MAKAITNLDIYDRLERLRLEVTKKIDDTSKDHKAELGDLRRQFETLEAGRLTRLEAKVTDMEIAQVKKDGQIQQNQAILSTKVVILFAIGNIMLVTASEVIVNKLIK